jgi:hypothetical protein
MVSVQSSQQYRTPFERGPGTPGHGVDPPRSEISVRADDVVVESKNHGGSYPDVVRPVMD